MKACGIPSRKRKYTKVSKGNESAPTNLLKPHEVTKTDGEIVEIEGFVALRPYHIWAEDFIYLWFDNWFYYLATVIDLYSCQIVGTPRHRASHQSTDGCCIQIPRSSHNLQRPRQRVPQSNLPNNLRQSGDNTQR
jgi:transposase InsO family protein